MTKRILCILFLVVAQSMWCSRFASAQASSDKQVKEEKVATCSGPVYSADEVSRKAEIVEYPRPADTPVDEKAKSGRVVLKVVLCGTGDVTEIKVVKKLPHGLTEKAIAAAKLVKFIPAEKDGQKVSQRALFEYTFNIY